VQFLGDVRREARNELLGGALALVHMTTRPERFGLTLIEAMACGTPVLGARMGSLPEIVVDGETGFSAHGRRRRRAGSALAGARPPRLSRARRDDVLARAHDRPLRRRLSIALDRGLPPPPSAERLAWRDRDYWERPMAFTEIRPMNVPARGETEKSGPAALVRRKLYLMVAAMRARRVEVSFARCAKR
jgi:hypothetical protein